MSLVFNIFSRHGVRFSVIDTDGTILLHSAVDFLRVRDIFEDCDFTIHLSSIEIEDCRPNYHHNFPEINTEDSEDDDFETSHEYLDSSSEEEIIEANIPIGLLFYSKEE